MRAVDEKRFRDAFQIGLVGYLAARDQKDETAENEALTQISLAIERMLPQEKIDGCHFCGRAGEGVRLAAGPTALICEHCVGDLHTMFASKSDG
jgi:RNA polymerase-binding transcription factor DksA